MHPIKILGITALLTFAVVNTSYAKEICFRNLGEKKKFGSYEQIALLRDMGKNGCKKAGIKFMLSPTSTTTIHKTILYDSVAKESARLKSVVSGRIKISENWLIFRGHGIEDMNPNEGFSWNKMLDSLKYGSDKAPPLSKNNVFRFEPTCAIENFQV